MFWKPPLTKFTYPSNKILLPLEQNLYTSNKILLPPPEYIPPPTGIFGYPLTYFLEGVPYKKT